eukprot:6213749-Pleurochrysis_carterae.AAC.7
MTPPAVFFCSVALVRAPPDARRRARTRASVSVYVLLRAHAAWVRLRALVGARVFDRSFARA